MDPNLGTIVDIAVADGGFKTLVEAVKAAGLVDTLKGRGPYTVFAPNDSAFQDLPAGTIEALLKDKIKLKSLLTYHVVAGRMNYDDLAKLKTVKTVEGKELALDAAGVLKVGGATIIQGNIKCRNGYIHVINKVLEP
ncbi:MAG TPA: fasciclin domain-containing protein [Methanomassiliicoccales archaeon]|nr:fasciclin domain-containing protein [Methanomassiliicoccales archaeon]